MASFSVISAGPFDRNLAPMPVTPSVSHTSYSYNLPMVAEKFVNLLYFSMFMMDESLVTEEFKQLAGSMKRLKSYYSKEFFCSVGDGMNRIPPDKRDTFRLQINNVLHKWNCYIVKHGKWQRDIPQLMLDTECECHVYAISKDVRRDPTLLMMKGALCTITRDEAVRRVELRCDSDMFDLKQASFFVTFLDMLVRKSHEAKSMTEFETMWVDPELRNLFIRQFHYYLRLYKH